MFVNVKHYKDCKKVYAIPLMIDADIDQSR